MDSINKTMINMQLDTTTTRVVQKRKTEAQKFDDLCTSVNNLPQELYDQIYEKVFTKPRSTRNLSKVYSKSIRDDMKLLHVSQATRAFFASSYYGNESHFKFKGSSSWTKMASGYEYAFDTNRARSWLKMLPEQHRALLHGIVLSRKLDTGTWASRYQEVLGEDLWKARYHVSQADGAVAKKVFIREVGLDGDKGKKWRHFQNHAWAKSVFLEGIQFMFDPGELWT